MAAVATTIAVDGTPIKSEPKEPKSTLTPPTSEEADKYDGSSSELSDLELDNDDVGEIEPDHYYEGGRIPVFKPTMKQFKSFKWFVEKIDKYGMKSGIVKVIPPQEWRDSLGALDDAVKTIKVKNPISQEFHGTHGTYTQANMEKQRSYNLPQWKSLCEESNHQPPAKRGERRLNQERAARGGAGPRAVRKAPVILPNGTRRGPGRPRVNPPGATAKVKDEDVTMEDADTVQVPPTPTSPDPEAEPTKPASAKKGGKKVAERKASPKPKGRQPKSVSQRRMRNSREQVDVVDEEAFQNFDYRVHNQDEWTKGRVQELETAYWKSLTFNNPMYGADMPGSLFDDSVTSWNVAKLENLLDVLGQKVPGVNTTYLYLGMWKATFAWHLEDVDLYSINYIHFGAPKQWYSISQADARRFERAMRSVWPSDSKSCDQFLRHKTYLISPQILKTQFNIEVNRLVHHEGEFVITFPYGYHSGYNLGYNCAESVNFATESWLDYGKVARKCNCEADSVWVDVWDIERKLRGEPTPELYEETEEEEDEDDDEVADLPTPPGSDGGRVKSRSQKRKRDLQDKGPKPRKKILLRMKKPFREPCCLCPNDSPFEELLPTDSGKQAHRRCGEYTPETEVLDENGQDTVFGIGSIDKARLNLKCNLCRNRTGAVFQCHWKKCTRAYHATCAAAAGVQVDRGLVPYFADDGTEYTVEAFDFRCRFHRSKRGKFTDQQALAQSCEDNTLVRKYGSRLKKGDLVQWQWWNSDIFAGFVVENRCSEQTVVVSCLPKGGTIEVEHQWLLVLDPAHSLLPLPSDGAKPLPAHLARRSQANADNRTNDMIPRPDDPFHQAKWPQKWAEFHSTRLTPNPDTVPVDLDRSKTLWYYLGKTSTEARSQYTGDISKPVNDTSASFLESVRLAGLAAAASEIRSEVDGPRHGAGGGGSAAVGTLTSAGASTAPRATTDSSASAHRRSQPASAPTTASGYRFTALASRGTPPPSKHLQHQQQAQPALLTQRAHLAHQHQQLQQLGYARQAPAHQVPANNSISPTSTSSHKPSNSTHPSKLSSSSSSSTLSTSQSTSNKRPYNGKYAIHDDWKTAKGVHVDAQALRNQKAFLQSASTVLPSHPHPGANNGFYQQGLQTPLPPSSTMGSASNGLPSMADVRRRSSHTLQGIEDLRHVNASPPAADSDPHPLTDGASQYANTLAQDQQSPAAGHGAIKAAPVANMGSRNSSTTPTSYSRPSTSHPTPPSSSHSGAHHPRPRSDSFKAIARYPYLIECAAQRPAVYQSPYAPGGGINEAWMSNPKPTPKLRRPRTGSLAQDFLMKRTPSQREAVKGHVRTISTEKAVQQQQEAERRQREQAQQRHQRNLASAAANAGSPTSMLPPNPLFQSDAFPSRSFSASPPFGDFGASSTYPHSHPYSALLGNDSSPTSPDNALYSSPTTFGPHPQSYYNSAQTTPNAPNNSGSGSTARPPGSSGSTSGSGGGLPFSTPHDFQLHMQRETEARNVAASGANAFTGPKLPLGLVTHDRNSYHAFVRDLQSSRGGMHAQSGRHSRRATDDDGDMMVGVEGPGAEGPSGSPLRRGLRAAGGEMLPMMQDPPF